MSANKGNLFTDSLVPMIGVLAAVGLVMYLAYAWVAGMSRDLHSPPTAAQQQQIEERIRPIGRVIVAGMDAEPEAAEVDEAVAVAPPTLPPAARELDGEGVYRVACTACHTPGIAGAPRTGDADAWEPRLERDFDTLVSRAIEGFQGDAGLMPARGGHANLTDEQVRDAVQYMVDAIDN